MIYSILIVVAHEILVPNRGQKSAQKVVKNFENVTLGLIACGSGNDFIKKSGHPKDVEKALDVILKGNVGYVDYMDLGATRCLNVAGGGMDVDVLVKYASVKKLKGSAAYNYALIYTLLHTRFHKLRLIVDGKTMDKSVFMIGIGNGGFIGGGLPICPHAEVSDGKLDVVIVNEMKKRRIPPMLLKFMKGKHVEDKTVEEFRTAILCGATLAAVCFLKILLVDRLLMGNTSINLLVDGVVSLTLCVTVVIAKFVGCSLPLLAKRLGFDPAVMASPFITTIVDALSLLVYFLFAKTLLGV